MRFSIVDGVTLYIRAKNVSSESVNLEYEFWSLEAYVNLKLSLYLFFFQQKMERSLLGLYLTKPFPALSEML